MKVVHLSEQVDAVPVIARWVCGEWGGWFPEITPEGVAAGLRERMVPGTIPETFVAVEDGVVIGTASIVEHDLSVRKEFSPWLAAVYVAPGARNRGVGSSLVRRAMEEARTLGVRRLYLFTPDRMRFYSRLGWRELERLEHRGKEVVVMVYDRRRGNDTTNH